MIHLHTIRILFRAPDTLRLYGIPYEMRKDVGQEPRHLWQAAQRRADDMHKLRPGTPVGPNPTAGWIFIGEDEPDNRAWLAALDDVPQHPYEWCECKLATDDVLNTTRRHDQLARVTHQPGDVVRVLLGYRGNGQYAPDGTEGLYVVKARMDAGKGCDYKLIRLDPARWPELALLDNREGHAYRASLATASAWDLISHASRLVRHYVNLEGK